MTLSTLPNLLGAPLRTAEQLRQRLDEHRHHHVRLGQFLIQENLISMETLRKAIDLKTLTPSKKLGEILTQMGAITANQAQEAAMLQLDLPVVELEEFDIEPVAVSLLPHELAKQYHLMPLLVYKGALVVAAHSLPATEVLELLRFTAKRAIEFVLASEADIDQAIVDSYHDWNDDEVLASAVSEQRDEQLLWQEAEHQAQQQPIVRLVHSLLADAVQQRASDIHIRPSEKAFDVLFRIDGTLVPMREFDKSLLPAVISRIKILSRLNIAERRLPQDGRIHFKVESQAVDMRVSMIPVQFGESVVIRILNKSVGLRTIEEIGFKSADEANFRDLLKRSYGIILVTGPTGSGKSTTLYAALHELAKESINVITVEDPIEYEIAKTRQIQLLPVLDFGFPEALRHILRHDPDVIMIGEMRDVETCKIAVESALTGHLVLSTLHTNDAPSALVRLMEIGIAPYMIRSAVIGVLAQRLVRCNCPHCKQVEQVDPLMRKNLNLADDEVFYTSSGCKQCHFTGFQGRMAIYELLMMNDALRALVQRDVSTDEYRRLAIANGMTPLPVNGVEQARTGRVSIAEVYRACM